MDIIKFIEEHLGTITLLLAVATFWLAVSTRQAAIASKNIFALESRPFLVFSKPVFRVYIKVSLENPKNLESQTVRLGIEFKNSSKVPVKYQIKQIHFTLDGRTVDERNFSTHGGVIYPSDYGIFWYGDFPFSDAFEPPKQGIIEYELEYSSTDYPRRFKKKEKMRYILNSFEPYNCDWTYIEDGLEQAI